MFVLTADQRASQRQGENVAHILHRLAPVVRADRHQGVVLPFERTVGDEIQAVFSTAETTVEMALFLQREGNWSVGIGIGEVTVLATHARASQGSAFVRARAAVERARTKAVPVPIALECDDFTAAARSRDAEALLQLLAAVIRKRSERGWQMIDAREGSHTIAEAAAELKISTQAASQRLQTALWQEVEAVKPLAVSLLAQLDSAEAH